MTERALHLYHFSHRLFVQSRVVEHILHTSAQHGKRRLQLVRGVADKLLLLLQQLLGTIHGLLSSRIEPPEFGDRSVVRNRDRFMPRNVTVQPVQQGIERTHTVVENPHGRTYDRYQQKQVQPDHPPQNSLQQFIFLESRRSNFQFVELSVPVLKYGNQKTGRLRLLLFRDVYFGIIIVYTRMGSGIVLIHRSYSIAVVRALVHPGQQLAREHPDHDQLRIVLQSIVHLVVDFVHHRKIKYHRPQSDQREQDQRQT